MKCPFCSYLTADDWQTAGMISGSGKDFSSLSIDWMRCANEACQQTIVRMRELQYRVVNGQPMSSPTEWIARPRGGIRPVDERVPEPLRTEYLEAAAILDLSPRMSAALSRQVLSDLLAEYAHAGDDKLTAKIERFTSDSSHPLRLRENLRQLPTVAEDEAGAGGQAHIPDVSEAEAVWMLDLLDRLFDYLIVDPARDEQMRASVTELIDRAGGSGESRPDAPA
jgi:hypothetical protein